MTDVPGSQPESTDYRNLLEKEIYTPDEAAEMLGMDVDVIYQAAHRGHLNVFKIGQDIVSIKRGDLVAWLETR
jgi:excisionase family DNA binding protein